MSFLITGLPRSRTAWFAALFNALGYPCKHEMLRDCESEEDFFNQLQTYGDSDCGLFLYPDLPYPRVIIERNCKTSLKGLAINFEDIDDRLEEIVAHCVGTRYDPYILELFKNLHIELKEIKGPSTAWAKQLIGVN